MLRKKELAGGSPKRRSLHEVNFIISVFSRANVDSGENRNNTTNEKFYQTVSQPVGRVAVRASIDTNFLKR
jgi:hypothetical protein